MDPINSLRSMMMYSLLHYEIKLAIIYMKSTFISCFELKKADAYSLSFRMTRTYKHRINAVVLRFKIGLKCDARTK